MTLTVEQQRIVEENLGLVRAVLSRCVSSPGSTGIYSYDDLFQIGCIALCEAVIRIPTRARRFFDLCLCSDTQPDLQCACMRHISPQKGETERFP